MYIPIFNTLKETHPHGLQLVFTATWLVLPTSVNTLANLDTRLYSLKELGSGNDIVCNGRSLTGIINASVHKMVNSCQAAQYVSECRCFSVTLGILHL